MDTASLQPQQEQKKKQEEISVKEIFLKINYGYRYLLSKWLVIVIFVLIGAVAGFLYAATKKLSYTASTTFVIEEGNTGGGLGQYAGLASMVGVDLGGGGGGIFQGDNLLELYKSRSIIQKALLSEVNINGKKELLVNRYIDFNKLREKWSKQTPLQTLVFKPNQSDRLHDSVMSLLVNDINTHVMSVYKPDKKLNIIRVDVTAKDEVFAKAFNDKIVSNVNDFYVQTKTLKSIGNLAILKHQTDSIRGALNGAIRGMAVSVDANPNANPARQILRVPSQRRQVDVEANKAILTELVKNLEISKITLRKETPLIQVIDVPILPLPQQGMGPIKGTVLGMVIFGFLAIFILLVRKMISDIIA